MALDAEIACYVDTSALVKRYVEEDGSDDFDGFCEQPAFARLICPLGQTEFASVMQQRIRSGMLTSRQTAAVRQRFLTDIVAGGWRVVPLSTVDALHLACALVHGASDFATADRQLATAARKAKLQVHLF